MESIEQVKQSFDSIILKFDENNNLLTDITTIKEIIQLILQTNEKYFSEIDFLNHRVFIILRDSYLNLLQQWHHGEQLDEISSFVFETIPNLFIKMSNHMSEKNLTILKELIFYKPILNELNICLEKIALNEKLVQDPQIKSLDSFVRAIQRLQRNRSDNKTDPFFIKLFYNIVKCICSSSFIQMFTQSTTQENDDVGQKFLLDTCTDYICSHSTDPQYKQSLLDIREFLLRPFAQWLTQQSTSVRLWNPRMSIILRQLCFILTLSIQHNRYTNLDKETFNHYCELIDSFINILYLIIQSDHSVNNKLTQSLMATLTPNLYTITLSNQLEKYLKSKYITSLILKLADIENDEIQLNAFRILSSILTEQDTKKNSNSTNISNLFIKFLTKIIDDSNQTIKFYNLLRCLKHLIHYDQIKDELIKQNEIIPLLFRCISETKFNPLQAQQPALEILLAFTFNNQAYQQLKENLNYIKPLVSSSHQDVLRAVDTILWRLEKQEESISKSKISNNTYKYDLMISYCHYNKDLTYQIYDQLIKDNFRVWINRDETLGTTMMSKANIIDQSEYILICMSDEYKQNSYCRCEAYYAYQCQYKIIPLILTLNSHPDGWLIDIIDGKIYIDFLKLDFDLAYNSLKNELRRENIYPQIEHIYSLSNIEQISSLSTIEQLPSLPKIEQISFLSNIEQLPSLPNIEQISFLSNGEQLPLLPKIEQISSVPIKIEYPSDIKQWTENDVKSFLAKNNFNCLLPIISEMNGYLIYDLYRMCINNRESMFHTLQNEILVLDKNHQQLTLLVYLRFLNEIQKYISITI